MKIALIIRRLNVEGGTQRQALFFAQNLKKRGHHVVVYTFLRGEGANAELLQGLSVVPLGAYPKSRNALIDFWNECRVSRRLAALIARDTELLNPHDQVSYRVAYYFKKYVRNIPSVWMMNDMPTKTWGYWRERECGLRRRVSPFRKWIRRVYDRYDIGTAIRAQDAIAVLDNRDREWVRQFFGKEATVVRSGLDLPRFPYRPLPPIKDKKLNLLAVGILFPHRRFEDLITAVKMLSQRGYRTFCTIVGGYSPRDPYFEKLIALRSDLGLQEAVRFAGVVSESELVRYYQESGAFVFPCHLQSWGMAVFEAMACGTPAIVSRSAGAHEVLTDGVNAFLIEPKDPRGIAAAVEELISNPALYMQISRNGRAFVEKHISWPQYADAMLELFNAAIVNSGSL